MSANTKIVVLRRKELIYTGIFAALGVLFLILLLMLLLPEKDSDAATNDISAASADTVNISSDTYIPGIYTTELILGSETVNVEVIVNDHAITSLRLADSDETLTTMYPLLQPTMDSLSAQICETQDLSRVTYSSESRYTSLILLEAIKASLEKARPTATPETNVTPTPPSKIPSADIQPAA